jgi:hypothetical protein
MLKGSTLYSFLGRYSNTIARIWINEKPIAAKIASHEKIASEQHEENTQRASQFVHTNKTEESIWASSCLWHFLFYLLGAINF